LGILDFNEEIKSDFTGWFDHLEKGDVSGHVERLRG
jgi:hypothetical protein